MASPFKSVTFFTASGTNPLEIQQLNRKVSTFTFTYIKSAIECHDRFPKAFSATLHTALAQDFGRHKSVANVTA
jgi:hypothetical protein